MTPEVGDLFVQDGMICEVVRAVTIDTCERCLHSIAVDHAGMAHCLAIQNHRVCLCTVPIVSRLH